MTQQIIQSGNRAVVINQSGSGYYANLYVNARNAPMIDWDITLTRGEFKTLNGATRWANKQVAA